MYVTEYPGGAQEIVEWEQEPGMAGAWVLF